MHSELVLTDAEAAAVGRFYAGCSLLVEDAVRNTRGGEEADGITLSELPDTPKNLRARPALRFIAPGMTFPTKKSLTKHLDGQTDGSGRSIAPILFPLVSEHAYTFQLREPVPDPQLETIARDACGYLGTPIEGITFFAPEDFIAPTGGAGELDMIADFVGEDGAHIGAHLYARQLAKSYPGPKFWYFRMMYYTRHQFAVQYIINMSLSKETRYKKAAQGESMLWQLYTPRIGVTRRRHAAILTSKPRKPIIFS